MRSFDTLTHNQKAELLNHIYGQPSYFESIYKANFREFDCKLHAIRLREEIVRLLLCKKIINKPLNLEVLHQSLTPHWIAYNYQDGVNLITTSLYTTDSIFIHAYHNLLRHIRSHILLEPFWFQATPTIRIHCPDAENRHHYPRYHSDLFYGHPSDEMNIWLPLTTLITDHGFRLIDLQHSKHLIKQMDYDADKFIKHSIYNNDFTHKCMSFSQPVKTHFGRMLLFDSRCIHSGEPLKHHTRVSMDIRILPLSRYRQMKLSYRGTGRKRILFAPGNCYDTRHSDQL